MSLRSRLVSIVSIAGAAGLAAALVMGANAPASAAAASAVGTAAAPAPAAACSTGTVTRTSGGRVCGVTAGGVTSYLGIRYAAPPIGGLRWKPPQPAHPWAGTFPATEAGPICPGPRGGGVAGSEDCLTLNVQIPAGARPGQRLPVMVEVHGGGFLHPVGPSDGSHLVTVGHLVYVAMNYRLGILGFMANKALGPHSGDYGLQDQQAAMRWVQRNIARFGGNPRNVTIFGQSAGGASMCAQIASPTAKGLFQRAIPESGFYNAAINPQQVWQPEDCKSQLKTEAQAQRAGAVFASKVGCAPANLACLRALPAADLVQAAGDTGQTSAAATTETLGPIINGTTLRMSPAVAFRTGQFNKVGVMNGVDRDEINGGGSVDRPAADTPAQFYQLINKQYGRLASTVLRIYPLQRFPSPYIAYRTVVADSDSVCPSLTADRNLARYVPVYAWQNDDADIPAGFFPSFLDPSKPNGAYHVSASTFLFPDPAITLTPNQAALGVQFTAQAAGYAHTGNPTAPLAPLWTRFTRHRQDVMTLAPAGDSALTPASTIGMQHHCGFWDAVTPQPQH